MRVFTRGKTGKYLFYKNRQSSFIIRCNINNLVQVIMGNMGIQHFFCFIKKILKFLQEINNFFTFKIIGNMNIMNLIEIDST